MTIDSYIAKFPVETRTLLAQVRTTIRKAAPEAEEVISYGMPAFRLRGMLVWYAGYKRHIGLYPTPSAIRAFAKELAGYKKSKGAVQFPLDRALPRGVIRRIVQFRVRENLRKASAKAGRS